MVSCVRGARAVRASRGFVLARDEHNLILVRKGATRHRFVAGSRGVTGGSAPRKAPQQRRPSLDGVMRLMVRSELSNDGHLRML